MRRRLAACRQRSVLCHVRLNKVAVRDTYDKHPTAEPFLLKRRSRSGIWRLPHRQGRGTLDVRGCQVPRSMKPPAANVARPDAFSFYAIACISMFESAVSEYVNNLRLLFQAEPDVLNWLSDEWLPEELEHGRLTRAYVEDVWPDFNWQSAFNEYLSRIPRDTTEHLQQSPALEALARCVTETHASTMYRCVASYSEDERLRRLLLQISRDEVRHYKRFRHIFESLDAIEENGMLQKVRTIFSRSNLAGGRDMEVTFAGLNDRWTSPAPFIPLTYPAFMQQVREVIKLHYPTESAVRMLLRPLGVRTTFVRSLRWILQQLIRSGLATRKLGRSSAS